MRRLLHLLLILIGLPALLVATLLLAANTEPGRHFIARQIGPLSGGLVQVEGLGGRLPFAPRLDRLEIRDAAGLWLAIEKAALDLNPWPLLRGQIQVESLTASSVALDRLPASEDKVEEDSGPLHLPPLVLRHLAIERVTLGQVVPDAPALSVSGQAELANLENFEARLAIKTPDREDDYKLELKASPEDMRLDLQIHEDPEGLITALLRHQRIQLPPEVDRWRKEGKKK